MDDFLPLFLVLLAPGSLVDLSGTVSLCSLPLPLFMLRHPGCFQKTQGGCGMLKVELVLVHLFLLPFELGFV